MASQDMVDQVPRVPVAYVALYANGAECAFDGYLRLAVVLRETHEGVATNANEVVWTKRDRGRVTISHSALAMSARGTTVFTCLEPLREPFTLRRGDTIRFTPGALVYQEVADGNP